MSDVRNTTWGLFTPDSPCQGLWFFLHCLHCYSFYSYFWFHMASTFKIYTWHTYILSTYIIIPYVSCVSLYLLEYWLVCWGADIGVLSILMVSSLKMTKKCLNLCEFFQLTLYKLILRCCIVLPCRASDDSLSELPVSDPKARAMPKNVFTLEEDQTVVQFDQDRDHLSLLDHGNFGSDPDQTRHCRCYCVTSHHFNWIHM